MAEKRLKYGAFELFFALDFYTWRVKKKIIGVRGLRPREARLRLATPPALFFVKNFKLHGFRILYSLTVKFNQRVSRRAFLAAKVTERFIC